MAEKESKIRIASYGGMDGHVSISGVFEDDQDLVLGALHAGSHWIRVKNGVLETHPSWEEPPDPIKDEEMHPFWRRPAENEGQLQLIEIEPPDKRDIHSIYIQHLCPFDYSAEGYQMNAELLDSYGFNCLRSRRGKDGRFWEVWLLPGLWAAKGDLRDRVGSHQDKTALKWALVFLGQNVSFGTLDVSVQRLAAIVE